MLGRASRNPAVWLGVIAAAYVAVQMAVLVGRGGVAWDEALYIGQVNPRVPDGFFSAPRARGITYLVAPVVALTDSITVLRAYLAVLSGLAIVAAYWPWLRLASREAVVPLAALAFAGLWVTGFYGSSVMPNFWVAVAAVATAGWFLRALTDPGRGALAGVVAGAAVMALMRPSDAAWVAFPLLGAAALVPSWRRLDPPVALIGGLALGGAQWLVEAFTSYGGILPRLRRAGEIQGGMGWHPKGVLYELYALNGPQLCRPCQTGWRHPELTLWWLAIPVLVITGMALARRSAVTAAAACGASVAVPYLLMLGYAAPRFLLPAYALLAIPVGEFLANLARKRRPVAAALAAALALHLAAQMALLLHMGRTYTTERMGYARAAEDLHRLGIRAPCLLGGPAAVPVAFHAGCHTGQTSGNNENMTPDEVIATAERIPVGILLETGRPPWYAPGWRAHPVPSLGSSWRVYVPDD